MIKKRWHWIALLKNENLMFLKLSSELSVREKFVWYWLPESNLITKFHDFFHWLLNSMIFQRMEFFFSLFPEPVGSLIKTFCRLKTSVKLLRKVLFSVPIMTRKSMLPANILKTPLPGQRFMFATVHVTANDIIFWNRPGMLIRKTSELCINSTWIALLIHGFVPVKTWQLIACDSFLCNNHS